MTSSHSDKHGFTLIELLTVIAIAALLIAMAVPALRAIQGTAVQVGARHVSNTMQLARQASITRRAAVRFCIAVDTSSGNIQDNLICRAYTVCMATNDANGNVFGWIPLQDWQLLPDGVVFSDLNCSSYDTIEIDLSDDTLPYLGTTNRYLGVSSALTTNAWLYFDSTNSMSAIIGGSTYNWTVSFVEFEPTGFVSANSFQSSGRFGGVRLMQGAVLDAASRNILVNSTNNWVYVEYDAWSGRVRTRYSDTYRYVP